MAEVDELGAMVTVGNMFGTMMCWSCCWIGNKWDQNEKCMLASIVARKVCIDDSYVPSRLKTGQHGCDKISGICVPP